MDDEQRKAWHVTEQRSTTVNRTEMTQTVANVHLGTSMHRSVTIGACVALSLAAAVVLAITGHESMGEKIISHMVAIAAGFGLGKMKQSSE